MQLQIVTIWLQDWDIRAKTDRPEIRSGQLYYMGELLVGFFLDIRGQEAYKLTVAA